MERLPVGYDSFAEIRKQQCYYIDKTDFIKQFLQDCGKVTLFTRPRRFGKTLMMSMLKSFFEINSDPSLFQGLAVSREKELCHLHQGKYPVLFISFKDVKNGSFQESVDNIADLVSGKCDECSFLLDSDKVSKRNRVILNELLFANASRARLLSSLETLLKSLHTYYEKKVILLIDEYDTPLNESYYHGYSKEMIAFMRELLGKVLKGNQDLEFAVLTGCFRISQESIFSGINNLKADTVSDAKFAGYFGFTDKEIKQLLADYGLDHCYDKIKEWYDGYLLPMGCDELC